MTFGSEQQEKKVPILTITEFIEKSVPSNIIHAKFQVTFEPKIKQIRLVRIRTLRTGIGLVKE